jgi:hypothetical protein
MTVGERDCTEAGWPCQRRSWDPYDRAGRDAVQAGMLRLACLDRSVYATVQVAPFPAAPLAVTLVVVKVGMGPLPSSARSTVQTVAETMQCAHGYSGCMGASMNGIRDGSRSVASLPWMLPLRIAVTAFLCSPSNLRGVPGSASAVG